MRIFPSFTLSLLALFIPFICVAEETNAPLNANLNPTLDPNLACIKIKTIEISSNEPFSRSRNRYARFITDALHYKTRDRVIKKELLFHSGECLVVSKLEETERNLRAMDIFSRATIRYDVDEQDNTATVQVETEDLFTFRFEVSASQAGGVGKTRFSVGDKNLLGLNKSLHYSHIAYTGEDSFDRYAYRDSRFLNRYLFQGLYTKEDGKKLEYYTLDKPFRTLSDSSAYGVLYMRSNLDAKYALDGGVSIDLPRFYESTAVSHAWQVGNEVRSRVIQLRLARANERFLDDLGTTGIGLPEPVETVDLNLGFQFKNRTKFLKLHNVDSLLVVEDIELARGFELGIGAQDRDDSYGQNVQPKIRVSFFDSEFIGNKFLQSLKLGGLVRIYNEKIRERIFSGFYHGYYFIGGDQSLVGGFTYQYRDANDAFILPLTLGGDVGLRGFDAGEFAGNKTALINFEYRGPCLYKHVSGAVCPTFFVDAGNAWDRGDTTYIEDLHINAGLGFRVGIPSLFGKSVFRIDFAAPIRSGKASVTAVLGQVFEYDRFPESQLESF